MRKLEELFELATDEENELEFPLPENTAEVTQTALTNLEKIEAAIPQIRGLEEADTELDELAELAKNSYKDIQDLAFQVEKGSADMFAAAGTMLGHAINVKTIKINKKLKQLELLLKKEALEQKSKKDADKNGEDVENTPLGSGKELDRNELLRLLIEKNNPEKTQKE